MRYTQRDCEMAVVRLAATIGVAVLTTAEGRDLAARMGARVASYVKGADGHMGASEDCIHLDYNPTYGGAMIEWTEKGHTGVWTKFGEYRMSPADFCHAVEMARRAVEMARSAPVGA